MKRLFTASVIALAALVPGVASAKLSHSEAVSYGRAYAHVRHALGIQTAGCKLIGPHATCRQATDRKVKASTDVLRRMLAPPAPPTSTVSAGPQTAAQSPTVATVAGSSLAACIISHESGGNPQATNGQYAGIGQWSPAAWAQDGGTRYAPTPLGASAAQQTAVLNGEDAAGMQAQQGNYDGC